MAKIAVLMLGGTGFPHGGDGVSEDFLSRLDPHRFAPRIVSYTASGFGLGDPYARSVASGVTSLYQAADHEDRFVLAGYSQGAVAAGDAAAQLPAHLRERCAGVALIADGRRPAGQHSSTPGHLLCPGYGVIDQRPIPAADFPVFWASAPGDPICALPAGNPLRSIADTVTWMSLRNPAEAIQWGAAVLNKAFRERSFQHWWAWRNRRDWDGAADFARGFLFDGRHTYDYLRHGHTQSLADALNRHVTE